MNLGKIGKKKKKISLLNLFVKSKEKPIKKLLPKLVMDLLLSNREKKKLNKGALGEAGKIVAAEVGKKVGESVTDKLKKSGDWKH